jgi:DNA-directed RNA polymerase subunit RPC12/RpoP
VVGVTETPATRDTPPVPPTNFQTVNDPDLSEKVIDREGEGDVECPRCRGTLYLEERQTGRRVYASWPDDFPGADEYDLVDNWPEIETRERCERCGWGRTL